MSLQSLTVNLIVPDVNETAVFYRDVLGFELALAVIEGTEDVAFELGDRPLGFAMLKRDAVEIMLQSRTSIAADLEGFEAWRGGDAVTLYIDVETVGAVEEVWEQLRDRVDVIKPLYETFYGATEFHFRDPNGFIVGFASRPAQH